MIKFNDYFKYTYLPVSIACYLSIAWAFVYDIEINWYLAFAAWFLIGPLGIGVGYHRLFSHRQFKTYRPVEYILVLLGTLSTYAPIYYWIAEHQHHHMHTDTERDINSPKRGFWHAFFYWRFTKEAEEAIDVKNRCMVIAGHDSMLRMFQDRFNLIIYTYMALTASMGLEYFIALFVVPVLAERLRLNILNSIVHINIPGSYQNYPGKDSSYNHVLLGYLTMGFGWHNNHHTKPRELINHDRWWEVDIEGMMAKLLSR